MDARTFGEFDSKKQHYECKVKDFTSLISLSQGRPFVDWLLPNPNDGHQNNTDAVKRMIDPDDFSTWFPRDENHVAIYGAPNEPGLTYAGLHEQINACPPYYDQTKTVVAIALPLELRAEMAVLIIALLGQANHVCVAPLDYNMAPSKMRQAMRQLGCTALVSTKALLDEIEWEERLPELTDVRIVEPDESVYAAGCLKWTILYQAPAPPITTTTQRNSSSNTETRMLLRTSGTTSQPKVVGLRNSHLLHYGTCLALGLDLKRSDVALNAMPLFHIGGIASALLCVLVSGSSAIMMPGPFDSHSFLDRLNPNDYYSKAKSRTPTWYYAAPTIHQALILAAKSRGLSHVPNSLRLIRSAAAHLPHATAVELATLFQTRVYPTYGMTECMPMCIPTQPIVAHRESSVVDTVGTPVGISLSIVNAVTGEPLEYGQVGEISVKGPGAIEAYVGMPATKTHTPKGYLKTGDIGCLDREGRLFIKGRSKEMIKRGGEQVWPNEIDSVVQAIDSVKAALAFGVPNELWGEEVALAVVLDDKSVASKATIEKQIMDVCRAKLDSFAVPQQVIFLDSTNDLPKGATGKYLRTQVASHLGVSSVDNGALRVLKGAIREPDTPAKASARPSSALNGIRFITACFVVQIHVGFFKSLEWAKIQTFSMSMPIFFTLLAFQMTCNVQSEVFSTWSTFVGTKIGSMHALFLVANLFAFPAWYFFTCGVTGYEAVFNGTTCYESGFFQRKGLKLLANFATGCLGSNLGILTTVWFQTVAYHFLIIFPWVDHRLRQLSTRSLLKLLVFFVPASMVFPHLIFVSDLREYHFSFLTWWPHLAAAAILGNIFKRHGHSAPPRIRDQRDERHTVPLYQDPGFWAFLTDSLSVLFLLFEFYVAFGPTCSDVEIETFEEMRPGVVVNDDDRIERLDGDTFVWVCDLTQEEWANYLHEDGENWITLGRIETGISEVFWEWRLGSPLILLWLYGLAFGQGTTARLANTKLLQTLAPLSYSVYLLHMPVTRYYYLATRGWFAEDWWNKIGGYPVPVAPFEIAVILGLSLSLGYFLDRSFTPRVMPYTVKLGVSVCQFISRLLGFTSSTSDSVVVGSNTTLTQIQNLVKSLSGLCPNRSSRLQELGLDSLGATAFLGNLRASLPAAKSLTLQQLISFQTVGDLVDFLDSGHAKVHVVKRKLTSVTEMSQSSDTESITSLADVSVDSLPSPFFTSPRGYRAVRQEDGGDDVV